jgi:DNA-binding NarL/FixJ family response regulator
MTLRVHLADDHAMFRQGMAAVLRSRGGIEVVGQSDTGPGTAAMVARARPDVIVTQLDMELKEAERILGALREASPSSKIVVLTLWDSSHYLRAVARMGIDALVHKSSSADDLVATVEAVCLDGDGKNAVVSLPRHLLERMGDEHPRGLTEREFEVVLRAARGLTNRQIAQELYISEATVKRHLANVYAKIGVRSRNEAVRRAIVEQWIGIHEITASQRPAAE